MAERFVCGAASLIRVHKIFSDALGENSCKTSHLITCIAMGIGIGIQPILSYNYGSGYAAAPLGFVPVAMCSGQRREMGREKYAYYVFYEDPDFLEIPRSCMASITDLVEERGQDTVPGNACLTIQLLYGIM